MSEQESAQQYRCCDEYEEYRRKQQERRGHSRRDFLKRAVGVMAAAPITPSFVMKSALAEKVATKANNSGPILVVLQLAGGNDGLNTIVPYGSDLYYKDRPTIGVPANKVIPIDHTVGFNPNLQGLKPLFDKGKVAILQGVGYPNPDRSHFRGTQIWESGDPVGMTSTGWLGRYLDMSSNETDNPLEAVAIGAMVPTTLQGQRASVASIESIDSFRFLVNRDNALQVLQAYQRMYSGPALDLAPYLGVVRTAGADAEQGVKDLQSVGTKYTPAVQYPKNPLATEFQLASQIINSGLGTRILHLSIGGFDDHVAEVYQHARLLQYLGDSLSAFYADLEAHGKADQVLVMTFSEFGRRVRENAGRGTDHGTAAPLFVVGGQVKGGIYGDDPILNRLDSNGDLIYGIDFRSVYGTVLDAWMGGNSRAVLGGSFERLPIL